MNEMNEEKAQTVGHTSGAVGHTSQADTHTSEVMRRFNQAFQRHDPDALTELVAEDCVIENTRARAQRLPSRWTPGVSGRMAGTRRGIRNTLRARRGVRRGRPRDRQMALFLWCGREQFRARREPDAGARRPDYRGNGLREEQLDARRKRNVPALRFRVGRGFLYAARVANRRARANRSPRGAISRVAPADGAITLCKGGRWRPQQSPRLLLVLAMQECRLWMFSAMEWQ